MASNLNSGPSGEGDKKPGKAPSMGHVMRITWMYLTVNSLLSNDTTFTRVEKLLVEMSEDPEMKVVAMLALLGMGMFDKTTFDLYKELQG